MACACKGKKNVAMGVGRTIVKRPSQLSRGRVKNRIIKRDIR